MLISIKTATEITNVADRTIRNWIEEGKIKKYDDESGVLRIDKEEFLKQIPTVLTVFNQKGGVGKNSTSVILADYFAKKGIKTLLVDFDQQGNLSQTYFEYDDIKNSLTLFDYFYNKTVISKIIKKYDENIDVLPADIKLSRKDNISLEDMPELKKDFLPIFKKYSVVIVDCPPALNSFSRFGIMLANYVICPVHPSAYSYDGAFEVLNTINKFIPKFNDECYDYRFLISKHHNRRYVIKDEYIEQYKNNFKNKLLEATIPEFVGVEERAVSFTNIFDMYPETDKMIQKIKEMCEEIKEMVYDKRGMIDG